VRAFDFAAMPGKVLGIDGQDLSDSRSSRLHVDIFRFSFYSVEVYYSCIDSSKMIENSPADRTSTGYFSNSTGSSVTDWRFSPRHRFADKHTHTITFVTIFRLWEAPNSSRYRSPYSLTHSLSSSCWVLLLLQRKSCVASFVCGTKPPPTFHKRCLDGPWMLNLVIQRKDGVE
jgi:hypothetical protein